MSTVRETLKKLEAEKAELQKKISEARSAALLEIGAIFEREGLLQELDLEVITGIAKELAAMSADDPRIEAWRKKGTEVPRRGRRSTKTVPNSEAPSSREAA
ncbi:hypothetical protein [Nitrospirillum amazonense]|uniref:hypothetical protein n=1 Tax=Nitrospirillum amazonense TaxID=28077 RepID=UPI00241297B0|nr:hypothetical protein [Nitrospirillum amazonense]MDG3443704.1 hypothetical protein [Nitrospirillum amazonense]